MFPALGVGPFLGGVDHLGQISGRRRRRRRSGRISVRRPARLSRGIRLATTGLRSGTYSGEESRSPPRLSFSLSFGATSSGGDREAIRMGGPSVCFDFKSSRSIGVFEKRA